MRQAAGDGFSVDADLGGGVHLREPAHDIKLHDLLIDLIQYALVSDALPVAAREVFQLLRQSQPRSYLLSLPSARRPGGSAVKDAGAVQDDEHADVVLAQI